MKKTVPLFWGDRGHPHRRLIGSATVDPETGFVDIIVTEETAREDLSKPNLQVSIDDQVRP